MTGDSRTPQAPARGTGDDARPRAGSTGRSWTIELPAGLELLSMNRHLHWAKHRRIAAELRKAGFVLARQAKIPPLQRARITAVYQPPTSRGRRDAENIPAPSAKHVIDGIVEAGVLPDDACPRYVEAIEDTVGEPYPRGRLVLHITEVAALAGGAG